MQQQKRSISVVPSIALVMLMGMAVAGADCSPSGSITEPVATVDVLPEELTLAVGAQARLEATTRTATGRVQRAVTWTSERPDIVTVTADGLITGVAVGTTQVRATSEGVVGVAEIEVVTGAGAVSTLSITPTDPVVGVNEELQLVAQARDANGVVLSGRQATWTVVDATVATVSASGVLRGLRTGVTKVEATVEGKKADIVISVINRVTTLTLSPRVLNLQPGDTATVAVSAAGAGGIVSDPIILWSSRNDAVASVAGAGRVTARAAGTTTIVAQVQHSGGVRDSIQVVVTAPPVVTGVTVTPASATLLVGDSVRLQASVAMSSGSAPAVSWSTTSPGIATVSASGMVKAVAAGSASIIASAGGRADTAAITVQAPPPPATDTLRLNLSASARSSLKRLAAGGTESLEGMWVGDHRANGDGTMQSFARYVHALPTTANLVQARVSVLINGQLAEGDAFGKLGTLYVELDQPAGLNEGELRAEAVVVAAQATSFVSVDITQLVRARVAAGLPVELRFRFQRLLSTDGTTNYINMDVGGLEIRYH